MKGLSAEHYLDIYSTRKEMQEKGITNPSEQIKKFTNDLVEKLKALPLDEEIILNHSFYDSKGNLILRMQSKKLKTVKKITSNKRMAARWMINFYFDDRCTYYQLRLMN